VTSRDLQVIRLYASLSELVFYEKNMKKILNNQERSRLDRRIADAEKRIGVQIVVAVIKRSDSYSELPRKAFALGVSVAGLLFFIFDLLWPGWNSQL
jgi:putative membrane protein